MIEAEETSWFKRNIYKICLTAGALVDGMAGWFIGRSAADGQFITIVGIFGGFFAGFLAAMFLGD